MIGKVIGSYEITELIGSGGMGSVYRAVDTMLDRDAAVKVLHPDLAHQPQVVERFRSEAKVLAKLGHPNIATVYSLLEEEDNLFMVLEFVPGRTVEQILRDRGALDLDTAVDLLAGVLAGVEHAHALEIVHRDLKPANLILSDGGFVKVMDFGIARIVGSDRMTRSGHIVGTLEYMSPEQIQQGEADARSDIYSLGVVLYEMLTGHMPFSADSDFELMKAQLEQSPPPPRTLVPGLPESVEAVILRALAKDPAARYQGAGEMREALTAALARAGGAAAEAARRTRLAAPGPAATRLAGAPARPATGATAAAGDGGGRAKRLGRLARDWIEQAARLSWQYWVIGAALLALAVGLALWPRGGPRRPAGSRVTEVTRPTTLGDPMQAPRPETLPAETPTRPRPSPPPRDPTPPGEREPPAARPAPPPAETPAAPPTEVDLDALSRSPIQRFADNYDELARLVEDMRAAGRGFQDDYRVYLKSARRWRPSGVHQTNWDQIEDFNKDTAKIKRDLEELADQHGLIEGGGARRLVRKARIGARDVSQMMSGNEAEASLRRLRDQAAAIDRRAVRIGAGLRDGGVSDALSSSWSRLRTKTRRVHQLLE